MDLRFGHFWSRPQFRLYHQISDDTIEIHHKLAERLGSVGDDGSSPLIRIARLLRLIGAG